MKLINLHLNTIFSFLESTITINDFIQELLNNNIEYFGITEHCNFYSMPYFLNEARKHDLKPIFGLDVNVKMENNLYRFIVYCQNKESFMNLKMLSLNYGKKGYIDLAEIRDYSNLIWIEHPIFGYYKKTNNILEIQNHYFAISQYDIDNSEIQNIFDKCLLINHNSILKYDDNSIIKTMSNISNNKIFESIYEEFKIDIETKNNSKLEELIERTNDFAKKLYFEIETKGFKMPKFKNDKNIASNEYLKLLLFKSIREKFDKYSWTDEYQQRFLKELKVIEDLNFADYFLVVQDWVNWAKNNNIKIGPGRGSAAGSLIGYLLNITEVDPIKYDLIFERFLNSNRVTMPDIDIDVQDNKRNDVIEYLLKKYGHEFVANIVTFSSLGKKSAIRDILRINNIAPTLINEISKNIENDEQDLLVEYNENRNLQLSLAKLNPNDESFSTRILNQAARISGFYRQIGTHAAGLVISDQPVISIAPVQYNSENFLQTQISMEYLEDFGLVKMDILGLKTLTTISNIVDLIYQNQSLKINLKDIDLTDQKTLELLSSGHTRGVFQVESPIMIKALRQVKVNNFEDIVAIISLNRPGPMKNVSVYAKRKFGLESIPKINNEYDKILDSTYGIIVYQEQIMKIAQVVAKMTFIEADNLRRIISKKKVNEMEDIKSIFIERAMKNGYEKSLATNIFNSIEKFASYGFNRSHAVSYSIITFQMAFLKAHYPLEFYTSCISSAHGSQDTIAKFVNEASECGVEIVSPDINLSESEAIIKNKKIILPLTLIKGLGPEIANSIVENRSKYGPYKNFLDFLLKISSSQSIGKSTIELLIKANTLRSFNYNQNTLLNEIQKNNTDTMLFIKMFKNNIEGVSPNIIDSYKPSEILNQDIMFEKKNEIELLGQVYNFNSSASNGMPGQTSFIDMHVGNEYLAIVNCTNVKQKISKKGNNYFELDLEANMQKIRAFYFTSNQEILNIKGKTIKVTLEKRNENIFYLRSIKEVLNEER